MLGRLESNLVFVFKVETNYVFNVTLKVPWEVARFCVIPGSCLYKHKCALTGLEAILVQLTFLHYCVYHVPSTDRKFFEAQRIVPQIGCHFICKVL